VPRVIYGDHPQGQATLEDASALAYAESLIQPDSTRFRDQLDAFLNRTGPGFVSSRETDEFLFARTIPVLDTPMPSGNALAILSLASLNSPRALGLIQSVSGWMLELPHATESLILGLLKVLETGQPSLFRRVNQTTIRLNPRPGTKLMINGQEFGAGAEFACPAGAELRYQICDDMLCGLPKTIRIP
jgi:hypothetical protein